MRKRLWKLWPMFLLLIVASAMLSGAMIVQALFTSWLIDHAAEQYSDMFPAMVGFTIAVMLLLLITNIFDLAVEQILKDKILQKTRNQLFSDIYNQNMVNFQKVNTAEYLSQMTNDMQIVENGYLMPLINVIGALISIVMSVVMFLYYSPIALLVVIIGVVATIFIPSALGKILQKKQSSFSNQSIEFTNRMKDFFTGYEIVASAGRKAEAQQEFVEENRELTKRKMGADLWMSINGGVSQTLAFMIQVSVQLSAIWLVMRGDMTIGTVIMLTQIMNIFIYPVTGILQCLPQMKGVQPVIERMESYLVDTKEKDKLAFEDKLCLEKVSFEYEEGTPILKNVDVTFEKGKKYAVIGPSGCGKSTMLKVLSGYFEKYDGNILVDSKKVEKQDSEGLFSLCAFIHQNVFLFDKTIKENICLYQEYDARTLENVIKKSGVAKFLGKGLTLDSETGENGSKLSGGQKQRIAIARAFIQEKPIILLDEGTSALDPQTAYEIENDLLENDKITLITITHHFHEEILQKYDKILYMQDGRIAEIGEYDSIMKDNEEFRHFIEGATVV